MKRTHTLRLATLLLALLMLAACAPAGNANSGTNAAGTTQQNTAATTAAGGLIAKYDPPIEVDMVTYNMAFLTFDQGDSMEDNPWTRAYLDELGIQVNFLWISDQSEFATKRELMLAGGDLADIFQATGIQFDQLYNAGLIQDLSQAYLDYASDDTRAILTGAGPYAIDAATREGKLMALPFTANQIENIGQMVIRTDWLDTLGLSIPSTFEELEAAMTAFATKDPDGNGKADTYNLLLNKNSFLSTDADFLLFYPFGAYPNTWIEDGQGGLTYGSVMPEAGDALAFFNRLYQAGAIHKEFTTIENATNLELVIADRVGMNVGGYYGTLDPSLQGYVSAGGNPDIWHAMAIPGLAGKGATKLAYGTEPAGYHVVQKDYAHPEVAVKFMNMWMQEFYINTTDEARYLQLIQNESGTNAKWNLALCQAYRPDNNLNNFRNLRQWHETGDQSYYDKVTALGKNFYNSGITYRDAGNLASWFWWMMICPEYENPAMAVALKNIEDGNLMPNKFYGSPTPTMTEKWSVLQEMQQQTYQSIVTGAAPLSSFDAFVQNWKALGGTQITAEINEWYAQHKGAADNIFAQ